MRAASVVKTANLCLVFAVPPVIALVIYATYAYSVGPLTPAMAFVVLSLFNTLRFPLVVLPKALRGVSGASRGLRLGPVPNADGRHTSSQLRLAPDTSCMRASFQLSLLASPQPTPPRAPCCHCLPFQRPWPR